MREKTMIRNILSVYSRSTPEEKTMGRRWYKVAHDTALSFTPSIQIGAGVISALFPNQTWTYNLELAERVIRTKDYSRGTYGANLRKAKRIIEGENPLIVLHGLKTIAFYVSILTSGEDVYYVTIDRHALSIALGRIATDKERSMLRTTPKGKRIYGAFSDAYREASKEVNLTPSELQAITWLTWRREKGE